jgi:hypothetical protein
MKLRLVTIIAALLIAITSSARVVGAAEPQPASEQSNEELAKKTQNPVADLISVPFQNNFNFNEGPNKRTVYVLNVQPVIPIHLTENWNLISRIITPIINLPSLAPGVDNAAGLGDINPTFFLSPAKAKEFIWGVGPAFTFPTASDELLGNGKFSAGPSAVGLMMKGPWVVGALANNQWSYAGWGKKEVNEFLMQPFVAYNFKGGWYLTSSPILTADWTARANQQWTVPVGGGGGKLFRLGDLTGTGIGNLAKLPINLQVQGLYNAIRPDFASDWQFRLQAQFLFPE